MTGEAGGAGRARVDVLTLFPQAVDAFLAASLVGRARREGAVEIRLHDLRGAGGEARRSVDDAPFGGGPGMVLAPGPVFEAVEAVAPPRPLLLMSPAGSRFDQAMARGLSDAARAGGFSLLCGRYEGVDQRVAEKLVDGELSVGDYVLGGGEAAALVVVEAVVRLLPGVMGNEASAEEESFTDGLLEHPQYTRPAEYRGWRVPEVLLSGDHSRVTRWRRAKSLVRTLERRPDLVAARGGLTSAEVRLLREHGYPVTFPWSPEEHVAP